MKTTEANKRQCYPWCYRVEMVETTRQARAAREAQRAIDHARDATYADPLPLPLFSLRSGSRRQGDAIKDVVRTSTSR